MQAANSLNSIKLPYQAIASDNDLTNNQSCAEVPPTSSQSRSIVQVPNTNPLSQASIHTPTSSAHEAISNTDTTTSTSLGDRDIAVFSPFSISSNNTEYLDFLFELLTWLDPESRQAFRACSKALYACIRERYPLSLVMRCDPRVSLDAFLKTIQSYADKHSAHPNTIQAIPDSLILEDLPWMHDNLFDILVKNFMKKLDSFKYIKLLYLETLHSTGIHSILQVGTKLESATFHNYGITDEAFKQLASIQTLEKLNISHCKEITDTGLEYLSNHPSLIRLNLAGCRNVSDAGIKHLSTIQTLEKLNISYCKEITDTGLEYFSNHPSLTSLDVYKCSLISDEGLKHVATMQRLCYIDLRYTCITLTGLLYLKALPNIHILDLRDCPKISKSDVDILSKAFKESAINCIIHYSIFRFNCIGSLGY